jgi:hypothetical protein
LPLHSTNILCLDFFPEGLMGNSGPGSESLSRSFQNRLQLWRMAHEQLLPHHALIVNK